MNQAASAPHGVKDLVVSCIDFRFRPKVAAWIKETFQDQADLVALAGASKAFLDSLSRDSVMQQIAIAVKLHGVERVHLLDHVDCGAYGGSGKHEGLEEEIDFHTEQCSQALKIIQEQFPQVSVQQYVVTFDGVVACSVE